MSQVCTAAPEVTAEQYVAQMIDRGPEPLRRLADWLSNVLDEDEWKTAERMLLGAYESAATASQICPHGIHWDNACGGCVPPRCDKVEKTPYIPPGLVLNPRVELVKPSPGPWTFEPSESDSSLYKLMDASGRVIGFLRRGTGGRAEWREFEANATLVASAPDLAADLAKAAA